MKQHTRRQYLSLMIAAAAALSVTALPVRADEPVKVVYHLSDGIDQASRALANIRNHLRAAPGTRIVVVGLGDGISFMLKEAHERNGKPFEPAIADLIRQGVEFRICMNTLAAHNVPVSQIISTVQQVPSGVAEIARLQAREGFAYLRP